MVRYRYRQIVLFFARQLLGFALWDLFLPRIGLRRWSKRTRSRRLQRSAQAFRQLAVAMGGVLIKVGQFLSSRVDVLPPEFVDQLTGLQDEVPAESYAVIKQVVESEYGRPINQLFAHFEEQALAAASLGQVHRAAIHGDGGNSDAALQEVVVKVQRPEIEAIIATDLAALRTVGAWLNRYNPVRRRADVPALLDEFTRILYEEIDYLAEGRNAEIFADHFRTDPGIRVPQVFWSHTTRRVLTLENVWGIKITDYQAITAAGIGREEVAARLLDTYLKQIFEDGFFHADPHPGNLFVFPLVDDGAGEDKKQRWQLTFVDFGMVGRVPPLTKEALREMVIGIGTQDAERVVKSYQMLGILLPDADIEMIKRAEAKAFEQFWGKDMNELQQVNVSELRKFAREFRQIVYDLPFQVPQDIIFLARAVGILSGMCTGLDPHFNVWTHLAPYAKKLIAEEAVTGGEFWLAEAKQLGRALLTLPIKLDKLLMQIEQGMISVRTPQISKQGLQIAVALRQLVVSIVCVGLLLAGVDLYLAGKLWPAWLVLGGAGLSFFWMLALGRGK